MLLPHYSNYVLLLLNWVDAEPSRYYEYLRFGEMGYSIEHPFGAETSILLSELCSKHLWGVLRWVKKEVWNILLMGWEDYCEEKRELFRERYPLESLGRAHVQD